MSVLAVLLAILASLATAARGQAQAAPVRVRSRPRR